MRRVKITYLLFLVGLLLAGTMEAREHQGSKKKSTNTNKDLAANCPPSTAVEELALNNVRFIIETGGNMWEQRGGNAKAFYIVPKINADGSAGDNSVLFAGSLWMGGRDPAGNLKLAAVRFRQVGNDFWPGPLANDGTASIDPSVCSEYDRFWRVSKQQAALHALWWDRINDEDPNNDNDPPFENGYSIPTDFLEWPGNGDIGLHQDNVLGPFFDQNQDGIYDPGAGDYPWYDLTGEIDCHNRFREDPVPLFGDSTLFWIFNDNGNIHTESSGQPIGMEIRAQAFEFASDDEINSMTFYNYVLINQGTLTLDSTYFGQWVDFDIGFSDDDYTGCDVQRGLGYGYNGDSFDEGATGASGYGNNPPAVGVDFFEGPFQDADGKDNPLTLVYQDAIDSLGIPYGGIGIGYGDGVVDNERFGMVSFVFHNNSTGPAGTQDPRLAEEYYNYLHSLWKDGTPMTYGGNGYDPGNDAAQRAKYMFPGDTDPIGWGTEGNTMAEWSDVGESNPPRDRRFIQSAGPFTLEPGNVNNITVGAVYGRSFTGSPFQSVEVVRAADDKAQNLFDNCFQIIEGPDQPDQSITELDEELILYLTNDNILSNNYRETYHKFDPTIPNFIREDTLLIEVPEEDKFYNFQGYKIYQLLDASVTVDQLDNPDFARLIFQTDIKDNISQIINYEFDESLQLSVPVEKVNGSNTGIKHAYKIDEDAFATTDVNLVNFKTYCFMAVAYGYNEYEPFTFLPDGTTTGQSTPYLQSRKGAASSVSVICGIPHKITGQDGGTTPNSVFGDGVEVNRIEGSGSGGINNIVDLKQETIDEIMSGEPWKANVLEYNVGTSPVTIFIADPLTVRDADFFLGLDSNITDLENDSLKWYLVDKELTEDTIWGDMSFLIDNEQLVPEYGIAINFSQYEFPDNVRNNTVKTNGFTDFIFGDVVYEDPEKAWLSGVPDQEGRSLFNWIRSGTDLSLTGEDVVWPSDYPGQDDEEIYENIINRSWTAFTMVQKDTIFSPGGDKMSPFIQRSLISELNSVDVVFTSDKSKWTRSAVLEAQWNEQNAVGGAREKWLRNQPSIDRDGNTGTDEATMGGTQPIGMSWFPGYAIDVTTGERLNIAFSEDSYLTGDNGNDMLWNPTSRITTQFGTPIAGGQHYIYIFKNLRALEPKESKKAKTMPSYDYGHFIYTLINTNGNAKRKRIFEAATWVAMPLLDPASEGFLSLEEGLIPTKTTVKLRVGQPYARYATVADISSEGDTIKDQFDYLDSTQYSANNWNPLYEFSTDGLGSQTGNTELAKNFMQQIRVVPNPYYSRSTYETSRLESTVKLINLPQRCTISIFNMGGTMVRRIEKDNPLSYQDWDLKNHIRVPVAGGTYIIHIDAGELGEVILKLFVVMRPADLENF